MLRLIHFIIQARAFFWGNGTSKWFESTVEIGDKEIFGHPKIVP